MKKEMPQVMPRKKIKTSFEDKMISFVCYTVVTLFALLVVYPILNLISVSISSYRSYLLRPWMFFPTELDFSAFGLVMKSPQLMQSYANTLFITVAGTLLTLLVTALTAYPISRPQLRFKAMYMTLIIITMMITVAADIIMQMKCLLLGASKLLRSTALTRSERYWVSWTAVAMV
jgi:putative aldouronate transport system permease protein